MAKSGSVGPESVRRYSEFRYFGSRNLNGAAMWINSVAFGSDWPFLRCVGLDFTEDMQQDAITQA